MKSSNFFCKAKGIILTTALIFSCLSVCGCTITIGNTNTEKTTYNNLPATEQTTQTDEVKTTEPTTKADSNEAVQPSAEAIKEAATQDATSNPDSSTSNPDSTQTDTTPSTDKSELKLVEQTLVDDETGISVSGKIPEGADMYIRFTNKDFMRMSDNLELTIENEISNPTVDELKAYKPAYNPIKFYSSEDWSSSTQPLEADGVPCIEVYFAKGDEVLKFESELTITAPIDFREFATSRKSDFNMNAIYFDNIQCKFFSTDVLATEETPSGCFAFKAYTSGKYCFGNAEFISKYLSYYNLSRTQVRPYSERNNY